MGADDDDPARWTARATAIVDVARAAAAAGPPPRGRPFFALDHWSPTPLELLDDLASRGIFRKYEHVLDLGAGLGATTRYLVSRLGCTATATAPSAGEATAGRRLTARAGLEWQVHHTAADPTALPFAEAAFTHVWIVDALPRLGRADDALAEAFRVLRPGGHLGLLELVLAKDDGGFERGRVTYDTRRGALVRAGFIEIVHRGVRSDAVETTQAQTARAQLVRRLGAGDTFVRGRDTMALELCAGRLHTAQFTARRP